MISADAVAINVTTCGDGESEAGFQVVMMLEVKASAKVS